MPAKKKPATKTKAISAPLDAAGVQALLAAVDKAIAKQPKPYDRQDTPRERLFAILMQRVDCLQEKRAEYLRVLDAMPRQPALLRAVGPGLYASLGRALEAAQLPHKPWHIGAVVLAYIATIAAWRNDTTADLAKTMKACDRSLAVMENIATMFPKVAEA